jgi:uncharacterized membrane protein
MTVERKVIALAAATVMIPVVSFLGVCLRWPDGAPSSVSYAFTLGTLGVGIAGFRLQRRLWPSADRLFSRTFFFLMLVVLLVLLVNILVVFISRGDWISVALYSWLFSFIIRMMVGIARGSGANHPE